MFNNLKLQNNKEYHFLLLNLKNQILYYYDKKELNSHENLVLNYANAALCSLIMRHDSLKENIFVIDIEKFIETKKNEIMEWKILNKNRIRKVYSENYENNLKKRIQSSNEITSILENEIEKEEKRINDEMVNFLEKIEEFEKLSQQKTQESEKTRESLKKAFDLKMFYVGAKSICSFAKLIGAKGGLLRTLMNGVLNLGVPNDIERLPNDIEKLSDGVKQLSVNFISYMKKKLYPRIIKVKRGEKTKKNENEVKELEDMDKIASTVPDAFYYLFNDLIIGVNEKIEIQALYEQNYENILALCGLMYTIKDFKLKLKNYKKKSNSVNDLNKWQIRSLLKEMRKKTSPLVPDNKDEMYEIVKSRVDDLIVTLIEMYNHIEKYLYQIELANFIEVMTSDRDYDMESIRKEDRNLIFDLKNIIHRNIIMEQYELALEAFKQHWSFPLNCEYLDWINKKILVFDDKDTVETVMNKNNSINSAS